MASDGKLIYTIAEWRKEGKDATLTATKLETYEFENQTLKYVAE